MIDPFTAFAAAQAAVAGIKKAVALGKDVSQLVGEFGKFFDAKDALQKAANDNAKSGKSDNAQALEIVMHAEQLRHDEEELKHLLMYGYGQPGLWDQLLLERSKIRQAREKRERAERVARIKARKQAQEIAIGVTAAIIVVGCLLALIYVLLAVMNK